MKRGSFGSILLLILAIISVLAGVLTLIPYPGASKTCLLGYQAICSFAPISAIVLVALGVVLFLIRRKLLAG